MNEKPFWTPPEPEPAPEEKPADEAFLNRWSRLKADEAARRREAPAQEPAPAPEETAPPAGTDEAAAEPPGEEALPPLEALDENSDYSGFMSPKVSGALRKQALRKLFRSQKFNYICELDDYIDDYTSFPVLGDIITADMKHAAEQLLKKQLEAAEGEAAAVAAATDDSGDTEAAAPPDEPAEGAGEEPAAGPDTSEDKQRDA
ncbi:DUF3306 domain-containing protein [Thioalkalivibrio sp. XN8]|uniref:DUF3306 domain-containing protein n=1 Tax=Thioalkalivibrio sp. XN8 TaxID=2712863 RepID=UPI0013ED044F|nr:DUF3306 domain-containing protein [Thioalkalivibrio sp. XN8]NGP54022.1 DUF3306 domain-containing protein [Thioalkalivibrio sp. XN8]